MTTPEMTSAELTRILREAAGEAEGVEPGADILDIEFTALGYDSVALLETSSLIGREYNVALDDDITAVARTPRELLGMINKKLATPG
jgi:minimal PKS acyl carrier protein